MSHAVIPQEADALRSEVCRLLCWEDQQDSDEYFGFQLETGCRYLEVYLRGDQYIISLISKRPEFWAWWRHHWMQRDREFLVYCHEYVMNLRERRLLYRLHNAPDELASAIYPNAVILENSYAEMMGELLDKK